MRRTRVFRKSPSICCASALSRPETGVPTAMSVLPVYRLNSTLNAASVAMNGVAPRSRASRERRAATSAGTVNGATAPVSSRTAGRGRSVGSSSGATPASRRRQ